MGSVAEKINFTRVSIDNIEKALSDKGYDMSQYHLGRYAELIAELGTGGSGGTSAAQILTLLDVVDATKTLRIRSSVPMYNSETDDLCHIWAIKRATEALPVLQDITHEIRTNVVRQSDTLILENIIEAVSAALESEHIVNVDEIGGILTIEDAPPTFTEMFTEIMQDETETV